MSERDQREAFIMGALAESQTRYSSPPTDRVRREERLICALSLIDAERADRLREGIG